ncbi:DUF547 domain-containing protein [Fundidesulfovibrio putealis]|uniref:DUF547 domain-containing protein n=1 Tax=Fundidesulfovibrio putealis TaxID=270496 RepID=UPI000487D7C2|nr:DUF547 domain-containing protein [Fundidesulfovibrio putealis]
MIPKLLLSTLATCLLLAAAPAQAQPVDSALFAQVLAKHVHNGIVDYTGLKADPSRLDAYLAQLAAADLPSLPERERFAAYINLYNAATIRLILDHFPVASIRDIGGLFGSPWKLPVVRTCAGTITLDALEHEILRKQFKDPRLHAAINCASKGCPPLLPEPYEAARLDEQLDRAARAFVRTPDRARLTGDTLFVSAIFDWFEADFGGADGVIAFVARHADPALRDALAAHGGKVKLKYLPYDWSLNGS